MHANSCPVDGQAFVSRCLVFVPYSRIMEKIEHHTKDQISFQVRKSLQGLSKKPILQATFGHIVIATERMLVPVGARNNKISAFLHDVALDRFGPHSAAQRLVARGRPRLKC